MCIHTYIHTYIYVYIYISMCTYTYISEVYALCLRYHTTTTMTPAEVHDVGLAEVARIEKRYQEDVLTKLGFLGTFDEFVSVCAVFVDCAPSPH